LTLGQAARLVYDAGMKTCLWGVLWGCGFLSISCVPTSNFQGPAYVHEEHAYAVSYDDAKKQLILGPEWILDNYKRVETTGSPALVRKETAEYTSEYSFDLDDDGEYEDKEKLPSYDLLFKNRKTNAQIWLSTIPLSREYADKELRVLFSNYVDEMSGSGAVVVKLGKVVAVDEKRFSARLVEKTAAKLSGFNAMAATIEVANVDQLKLSPDARREKVRVVLARPNFMVLRTQMGGSVVPFRVLMVAGYSNNPEDFEAQYPEFERFLGKVHLLSDVQVLELARPQMQDCAWGLEKPTTMKVAIAPLGSTKLEESSNLAADCAKVVLGDLHFPRAAAKRSVEYKYDWSKPANVKWLSESTYKEAEARSESAASAATDEETATANEGSDESASSTPSEASKSNPDTD